VADMQSCKECGRIFTATRPGAICPTCKEKEYEALTLVTQSLRDEPGQSVEELSEDTGVDEKLILKFIREGKIASDAITDTVPCGRCGQPAKSLAVRLCTKCLAELQRESATLMNKPGKGAPASAAGSAERRGSPKSDRPADDTDPSIVHHVVEAKRK